MARKITNRSTKAQILEAYQELQQANKNLEGEIRKKEQNLQQAQNRLEKSENALKQAQQNASKGSEKTVVKVVGEAAKVDNVEGLILTFESIEQGLSKALGEVSKQLVVEAEQLARLGEQIEERIEKIKKLYQLDDKPELLEQIIEEYEATRQKFEEEFAEKKRKLEKALAEAKAEWEKEKELKTRLIRERNEAANQSRNRDIEVYEYELEHARDLELDEYEQKVKKLHNALAEEREQKENTWKEREEALAKREEEYAKYAAEFEELPKRLEQEIKKAEAEGKAITEKNAKIKAELRRKEIESQKSVYELKINSLEKIIAGQQTQIAALNQQVETSLKQAQSLAIKSLEGASSNEKYQTLREIALEQAKNQAKSK